MQKHPAPPRPHSPEPSLDRALVWLRRDLRDDDNAALSAALSRARQVWCVFVFDTAILQPLLSSGRTADRRVEFIHASLEELDAALRRRGGGLIVRHARAAEEIPALAETLGAQAVFAGLDYEPDAVARDAQVRGRLADRGVALYLLKDQAVLDTSEVLTGTGTPFSVFTPYKNAWLRRLTAHDLQPHPLEGLPGHLMPAPQGLSSRPSLASLGFTPTGVLQLLPAGMAGARNRLSDFVDRIDRYDTTRDFPAQKGPSYLGIDLRFGTLSIRHLARLAHERFTAGSHGAEVWLTELIWREFYMQVLHHRPQVVTQCFRPEYDAVRWEQGAQADELFAAWCEGRTGYPLVDAAMAQLNQTGYMHNRLRMVTASFLTKDLGLDWRRGERYFALHLNDYELASNNGGWQWAASTGCDAQPYFRIFNPVSQSERFDPQGRFIRRYLPQLSRLPDRALHAPWRTKPIELMEAGVALGSDYPYPVVDHAVARERTLARFARVKR